MNLICKLLFILCFDYFLYLIQSLQDPGRTNNFYQIGDYYGSRVLDVNNSNSFIDDQPVIVTWSTGRFLSRAKNETESDLLWIADSDDNTLKRIDSSDSKSLILI